MFAEKILRAFPLLILIKCVLAYILFQEENAMFFGAFLLIMEGFNYGLKHFILEPVLGKKSYPYIGSGARPKGAKNCGNFADGLPATTYGMPSGHSQFAMIVTTYLTLNLLNASNREFPKHDILRGMMFIAAVIMGVSVCLSRIYFKCHTYQQVIAGGMIGIIAGAWYYYQEDKIIKIIKNFF